MVTQITRSWRSDTPACLDHIYVNQEDFVEHVFVENTTGTDHYAIGVKIRLLTPVYVSSPFLHRSVDKVDKGEFEQIFCNSRVYEVYKAENVNEALGALEFKILRALNIVAPEKRIRPTEKYAKWMTPELLIKVKRRNAMRLKAEKSRNDADWRYSIPRLRLFSCEGAALEVLMSVCLSVCPSVCDRTS